MRSRTLVGFLALLAVTGCGGGGALVQSTTPVSEKQVGPVAVQGADQVLPPVTTSSGATLYALTGAISSVKMTDTNPTVDETEVYFAAARGAGYAIMASSPDGGGLRVLANTLEQIGRMQVIGDYLYYIELNPNTASITLYRVSRAGGPIKKIKSNVSAFTSNLSGNKIYAFQVPSVNFPYGRMISFNPDGSSTVNLFAMPDPGILTFRYIPGVLSDGSIVIVDHQGSSSTWYRAYSPAGGIRSQFTHSNGIEATGMLNGTDHVFHRSSGYFERLLAAGGDDWPRQTVPFTTRYDGALDVSPGESHFVFANSTQGIIVHAPGDNSGKTIYNQRAHSVAWGPLVTERDFVGTGQPFTSVGCLVFSDLGSILPAVVWADATTRASIQLSKVSADGAQNVVYRMDCDNLSKLAYTNSLNYTPINVVTTTSNIIGVLIALNSVTGKVESLTTFKGSVNAIQENGQVKVTGADTVYRPDGSASPAPAVLTIR